MWRFIVRVFAVIGFLSVLAAAGIGVGVYLLVSRPTAEPPPDRALLELDLRQPLADERASDPLMRLVRPVPPTLREAVTAVDLARDDDRVVGLVLAFGGDTMDLAAAQELGDAISRFRATGRLAFAYADSFGELSAANNAYVLASNVDEIWLRPDGMLGLTGIRLEMPFAGDALDDLGVLAELERRGEYKNFPEMLTRSSPTPSSREMMQSLASDLHDQMTTRIAAGRGLASADVARLIDEGPYVAEEALANDLVDRLGLRHAFDAHVADRLEPTGESLPVQRYLAAVDERAEPAADVALIYATGTIVQGNGGSRPLAPDGLMGADTIAQAIDDAVADDELAAIVLRINSGGGSAVASAIIGEAVSRARDQGKPLIVSMGMAAASGGYWIATHAREIVAEPATLTGSIGVFGGKLVVAELSDDLGITWSAVQRGRNADFWSIVEPYSLDGAQRLSAVLDDIYGRFVARVADGRDLSPDVVADIAGGRVWTGAQALEIGLVDRLGGLEEALVAVREALGLAADAPLRLVELPKPRSPFERVSELLGTGLSVQHPASPALDRLAPVLAPLVAHPGEDLLRMPPLRIGG